MLARPAEHRGPPRRRPTGTRARRPAHRRLGLADAGGESGVASPPGRIRQGRLAAGGAEARGEEQERGRLVVSREAERGTPPSSSASKASAGVAGDHDAGAVGNGDYPAGGTATAAKRRSARRGHSKCRASPRAGSPCQPLVVGCGGARGRGRPRCGGARPRRSWRGRCAHGQSPRLLGRREARAGPQQRSQTRPGVAATRIGAVGASSRELARRVAAIDAEEELGARANREEEPVGEGDGRGA